jgi:thiazole/oxazole-forming peptide maturase SagC family component
MSESHASPRVYSLNEGVRIFRTGEEIRFRKGIWNFNEAVIRLAGQGERVAGFFGAVYERLCHGREADADEIGAAVKATPEELGSYAQLLENLERQQYLRGPRQRDVVRTVNNLLGGSLSGFEEYVRDPRPVLFFSDNDSARAAARLMADQVPMPLDFISADDVAALGQADLTTRVDAVQHERDLERFSRLIEPYAVVVCCAADPNVSLLRSLNRVLVHLEKPLVLGLIDGPFVSLLAAHATQTGCFECYEQRMLARQQDTLVYHEFVRSTAQGSGRGGPQSAPALHLLTSAALSEAFLYASVGMSRLAGRVVNVYLPLLEIQVQDLLRVPYCPACGFVAKAHMNELYTSSKRLVDEMLKRVELKG